MNNLDIILSMFEEIKASQQKIQKRLEASSIQKENSEFKVQIPGLKELEDGIVECVTSGMCDALGDRYIGDIRQLKAEITKSNSQFEDFLLSNSPKLKHQHRHTFRFELKSSKIPIAIGGLILSCLLLLFVNISFFTTAQKHEDSDWKYRFIKANKGVTGEQLQLIEKAFAPDDRNEESIETLKKLVLQREKEIDEKARNLEFHELIIK